MTTEDDFVPLKKPFILQNVGGKNQFSNLNLNQSQKCFNVSFVQSNSKSINKSKYFDLQIVDDDKRLWNKSSSNTFHSFKSFTACDKAEPTVKTNRWKNDSSDVTTTRSSTLSLHIVAYENYIENGDTVTSDKNEGLSKNLIKGQKQSLINSTLNLFEFPRQQKDDENDPAVMQFTASQQLLDPNQLGSLNVNQQGTQNAAAVRPDLVHFNQRPPPPAAQIFGTDFVTTTDMLRANNLQILRSLSLDVEIRNNLPDNLIYVRYSFTERRLIFENSDDKEHDDEFQDLYMDVRPEEKLSKERACLIIDYSFVDLPSHWKYLESCIALDKFPKKRVKSQLILVEKFKNVAIAYDYIYVKQPVAIFRQFCPIYDKLKVGEALVGKIGKLYVGEQDKPVIVLTDLYCMGIEKKSSLYRIHDCPAVVNVTVSHYLFDVDLEKKKLKKFKNAYAMLSDFGVIVIPNELLHLFDLEDARVDSSLIYRMRALKPDFFACWELGEDFKVYVHGKLHAVCKFGEYHLIPQEEHQKTFEIWNGREWLIYNAPSVKQDVELVYEYPSYACVELKDFISFCPEKKRDCIR